MMSRPTPASKWTGTRICVPMAVDNRMGINRLTKGRQARNVMVSAYQGTAAKCRLDLMRGWQTSSPLRLPDSRFQPMPPRTFSAFIYYHYPPMVFSVECVSYRSYRSRSSEACAEVGNFSAWLRAAGPEAVGLRHVRRSTIREDSDAWQPSCMPYACRMATHTYSTILSHSLGYPALLAVF